MHRLGAIAAFTREARRQFKSHGKETTVNQKIVGRIALGLFVAFITRGPLHAQQFKLFDRTVQVHGFASQGFVHTDDNNWLTMNTSKIGSGEFTDFGANASTQITDKFRMGAQIYDRNLGQLGRWHPELDWAFGDFKIKPWLGVRGGKIKTVLGLFNDTQDMDFLHTFALLPQSVYSTDMRDSTLSHIGGDLYGTFSIGKRAGKLSYTVYGGDQIESIDGGYPHLLKIHGIYIKSSAGPTYGGDLRWITPVKGLIAGGSYERNETTNTGLLNPSVALGGPDVMVPYKEWARKDFTQQFYSEYTVGKLRIDAEYRRFWRDFAIFNGEFEGAIDPKSWYTSADYQVAKRLSLGGYFSHYAINWIVTAPGQFEAPSVSSPDRHLYDKVVTARFDLKNYWYAKLEGHFMDGYAGYMYPDGFYPQVNAQGACDGNVCQTLQPNTNALVVKTGFNF